jgi:hypothetical protein
MVAHAMVVKQELSEELKASTRSWWTLVPALDQGGNHSGRSRHHHNDHDDHDEEQEAFVV